MLSNLRHQKPDENRALKLKVDKFQSKLEKFEVGQIKIFHYE